MSKTTKLLEIFRAGTQTDASGKTLTFSDADLQAIAANYDPSLHEAPIVIGHPKGDAPAYGWVGSLSTDGKLLSAEPTQVDADFAELVEKGRFKKISASFYLPNAAGNPKPDSYYLRHVGFLGAQPPAVKGLKSAEFNDAEDGVVEFSDFTTPNLFSRLRSFIIENFGLKAADDVIPEWQVNTLRDKAVREEAAPSGLSFAEDDENQTQGGQEADKAPVQENQSSQNGEENMSDEDKKRLADLEAENAQLKANAAKEAKAKSEAENTQFAEALIEDGKLLPKQKDQVLSLLNAETSTADFSESGYKSDLKAFLSELPTAVDFSETATKDKAAEAADESIQYAEGTDPERIALDQKARAYMAQHDCDYATAVNAVA